MGNKVSRDGTFVHRSICEGEFHRRVSVVNYHGQSSWVYRESYEYTLDKRVVSKEISKLSSVSKKFSNKLLLFVNTNHPINIKSL